MADALTYFYYFFNKMLTFVFSTMAIQSGVTVGWIIVSVIVMGMLVRTILNIPKGVNIRHPSTTTFYDKNGSMTGYSVRKRG